MKKKLLRVLAVLFLLLVGGLFGLQSWLRSQVNRTRLVAEMEKGWNCRAELDTTTLGIFRSPARVELSGLRLAPRDELADTPLKDRPALDPSLPLLTAERIELAVSLTDFLWKRASIRRLHIENFTLRDVAEADDEESLLDALFAHPDEWEWVEVEESTEESVKPPGQARRSPEAPGTGGVSSAACADQADQAAPGTQPEIKSADSKPGEDGAKPRKKMKKRKKKREHKPFKASDLKMALAAEEASVEHARIDLTDHGRQTHTLFDNVRLALKGLDVAPDDLKNHNRCNLELSADIKMDKTDVGRPLVNCSISGSGYIKPFDVETGLWNTDLSLALNVRQGSLLGGTLMKEHMREKDAKKLQEYGIDLGGVALGGVLGQDASTDVHLANGKLIVKKDTRLVFPQYEIALSDGSWFYSKADSHIARGELVVGAELSAGILDQAQKKLAEKYGDTLAVLAMQAVKTVLMDDEKRMVIKFKTRGKLSKPEITWDNPLNDLKDLLKGAGASVLDGLLGK